MKTEDLEKELKGLSEDFLEQALDNAQNKIDLVVKMEQRERLDFLYDLILRNEYRKKIISQLKEDIENLKKQIK